MQIDVSGIRELSADLTKAGPKARERVVAATRTSGNKVKADMQAGAPKRTGELASSVTMSLYGAGGGSVAAVVGPTARYGIFQEIGTVHHAPQPFAQPALNKNAGPYEQALGKAVEDLL